jgi:hypothetical protein
MQEFSSGTLPLIYQFKSNVQAQGTPSDNLFEQIFDVFQSSGLIHSNLQTIWLGHVEKPSWLYTVVSWWAYDKISDSDFAATLQYLVDHNMLSFSS